MNEIRTDNTGFKDSVRESDEFETWEVAKKIEQLSDEESSKVFGTSSKNEIFHYYTYKEAKKMLGIK